MPTEFRNFVMAAAVGAFLATLAHWDGVRVRAQVSVRVGGDDPTDAGAPDYSWHEGRSASGIPWYAAREVLTARDGGVVTRDGWVEPVPDARQRIEPPDTGVGEPPVTCVLVGYDGHLPAWDCRPRSCAELCWALVRADGLLWAQSHAVGFDYDRATRRYRVVDWRAAFPADMTADGPRTPARVFCAVEDAIGDAGRAQWRCDY